VYAVDVSEYVAGIVLGREWEPNGVYITNQKNQTTQYQGDFISLADGNAMEAWLAEVMDFTVLYETQTYQMQHPVSFVNWLTLDPLYHNTEIIENEKVREFDNDLEVVHFERFHTNELFDPGIFASYHAYPYYPDYVYLKEEYANAVNIQSKADNYFGYLKDLKANHGGMPLVIAEYGIPSSRGSSHKTPFGFDQGGHSEARQAEISMMLTRDIFHTGCAGAVYFEWTDEWFKHNWLVMDFEKPFEDRKLWHNMENPEQNFGIMALESRERTIDADFDDWNNNWRKSGSINTQFHADPAYFYMAATFQELDFKKHNLYIAIDTYSKNKGDHRLPFYGQDFSRGFEFLVEVYSPGSANILVDEPYSVYTDIYNDSIPVYASKPNSNGRFVAQELLTNRGRVSLTGEYFPPKKVNRSPLVFGKSDEGITSNADWFWSDDKQHLEMRLTWHLLNVSDPAKNYVLDDKPGTPEIEYTETDGFRLKWFITNKSNQVIEQIPEDGYLTYLWEKWNEPEWSSRLKPLYDSLQHYFAAVNYEDLKHVNNDYSGSEKHDFKICKFYRNLDGAASFSFRGNDYSHLEMAIPVLDKYHVKASFALQPDLLAENSERLQTDAAGPRRRATTREVMTLYNNGHDLILHTNQNAKEGYREFSQKTGVDPEILVSEEALNPDKEEEIYFSRSFKTGNNLFRGIQYRNVNGNMTSASELDSLLTRNAEKWVILNYQYLTNNLESVREQSLFSLQKEFEWHLRLARNHRFWLAGEWDVYRYLKERKASAIKARRYDNNIIVEVDNDLDKSVFDFPLTVCYQTDASYVRVSTEDREYTLTNRKGSVYFDIIPGQQVTLKEIW
jgi:hypothetical protein